MQKTLRMVCCIGLAVSVGFSVPANAKNVNGLPDGKGFPSLLSINHADAPMMKRAADSLYNVIGLASYGLERNVFFSAFKGLQYFVQNEMLKKANLLTIADYSQSSTQKRLYVIDVLNGRVLFNTYVSHGKNSGKEFATSFSNVINSNKSSLGFMITGETYNGKAGYSLRLDGMEPGINDKVRKRAIVMHGSRFVNETIMYDRGTIGNSLGCPAIPYGQHSRIIDAIKGGSVLYIHHPDQLYARNSAILNAKFDIEPLHLPNTENTIIASGPVLPNIKEPATLVN